MDCKEVRNLLSTYLENEKFPEREFIHEHLKICKNCAGELEELKATISTLAGVEKLEVPSDFLEGVHRKIKPEHQIDEVWKKLFYPLHIKLPLEAVAVAATVFLVLTIYNQIALQPKPQQLVLKSELAKAPQAVFYEREATITLVSENIDRDLKLLPALVNEVGGKIIVPPKETSVEKTSSYQPMMSDAMKLKEVAAPIKSYDMTFQIPQDKMSIFMYRLEAIAPPEAEYGRELKSKELSKSEPVIIHLKLNSPQ